MKTAVVFYSLDGNCAFAAQEINALVGADLIRLHTQDEKRRSKFGKLLYGCGMVFRRKKPALKPYTFDPSAYDLIVIGAPVWAGSFAPPLRTFISDTGITGKKIAFFICHGGGMGKAKEKFRTLLAGNEIVTEADFKSPYKNPEEAKQKIADWVKTFA